MKKLVFTILLLTAFSTFAQTQKFDVMTYTPPKGWTLQKNDNAKVYSTMNKSTNKFCLIMLYPSIQSNGNAEDDFKYVWKQLVQDAFKASGNPEKETAELAGFTMIQGGELIDYEGTKALAMVTILSGKGRVISLISIMNDAGYTNDIQAFFEGMDVDIKETPKPEEVPQTKPITANIVGHWQWHYRDAYNAPLGVLRDYRFDTNGNFSDSRGKTGRKSGKYSVSGNDLTIVYSNGESETFTFGIENRETYFNLALTDATGMMNFIKKD